MRTIKRMSFLLLAAAVFTGLFGVAALHAAGSTYDPTAESCSHGTFVACHADSASITNTDCQSCHGVKANDRSLDPLTFSAHKRHLKSAFMRFQVMEYGCGTCHVSTDVLQGSGATVNRQVDAAVCISCHGAFTESADAHVGDLSLTSPRGCTVAGCHNMGGLNDPAAKHAAAGYVNTFFATSRVYCTKCHGGLQFYVVEETDGF